MLGTLRENSRSVIIWVLFGIIIAFFVLSFGPQASADQFSCHGSSPYVAKVGESEVREPSWRFGYNALSMFTRSGDSEQLRFSTMDGLIARELYAQAAEAAGFRIPDELLDRRIADGELYVLGQKLPKDARGMPIYYDESGAFDYRLLANFAGQLSVGGVGALREEQRREMLAATMRELLGNSARISPDEALARFRQQSTTAALAYLKLRPLDIQVKLDLAPNQVATYLADHAAEVKARYDADERTYKGVPKQVSARHVFVARKLPAPAPGESGEAPTPSTSDPARAAAETARARLVAGAEFAVVAAELSDDERTKARGGGLGWRSVASMGWGPEVSDAVKDLEVGAISPVIETARGFHVLRVDATREGDLSFDDVKLEIAETLATEHYAREIARADAERALAFARSAGRPLQELFAAAETDADTDADAAVAAPRAPRANPPPATDGLPRPKDLALPDVQTTTSVTRDGDFLAGIGQNKDLVDRVFSDVEAGQLLDRVYEVEDGFVVVEVTERTKPDLGKFASDQDSLISGLAAEKSRKLLADWVLDRCKQAAADQTILINKEFVTTYDSESGEAKPMTYQICGAGFGI
jgi:peptidyl-prolyl cis-trans isomerase D